MGAEASVGPKELPWALRAGVAAVAVPRGTLLHDALRWQVFLLPAGARPDGARSWLLGHGLLEGAPVPKTTPRLSQVFYLRGADAPRGELRLAPGARFSCVCCGASCRSTALGPLQQTDIDRLSALDWSGTGYDPARFFVSPDGQPLEGVPQVDRGEHFLRRVEGGACQFLRPDQRCDVHARFGGAAKPQMCRQFPVQLRASPSGIWAGMRLGECLSAEAAMGGELLADRRAEVAGLWDELEKVPVLPPLVWLAPGALVPWADYQSLEEQLLSSPSGGETAGDHRGGLGLILRAEAALQERAGAGSLPPDPEVLAALGAIRREVIEGLRGAAPHRGLLLAGAEATGGGPLALEEQIARLSIFGKDAFQHETVASGFSLLALEAWLARAQARSLAAAAGRSQAGGDELNRAWKQVSALALREELADRKLPSRAVAAGLRAAQP